MCVCVSVWVKNGVVHQMWHHHHHHHHKCHHHHRHIIIIIIIIIRIIIIIVQGQASRTDHARWNKPNFRREVSDPKSPEQQKGKRENFHLITLVPELIVFTTRRADIGPVLHVPPLSLWEDVNTWGKRVRSPQTQGQNSLSGRFLLVGTGRLLVGTGRCSKNSVSV